MPRPTPPTSGKAVTLTLERDCFTAGASRAHSLDDVVAALRAQQAHTVHLRISDDARENYERVGMVVYGLSRHGFTIGTIESDDLHAPVIGPVPET